MVAWSPYAIIALYAVFVDEKGLSPLAESIASFFAKSSMLWTAVLYYLSNRIYPQSEIISNKKSHTKDSPLGNLIRETI